MGHTILIIYIAIINLYGILIMYLDKKRSIKGQWRIPESRFFITALLLGSLGILLGMKLFRHKTKHWYFNAVNIVGILWQIGLIAFLFIKA